MHDMDRTKLEMDYNGRYQDEYDEEHGYDDEYGYEDEDDDEYGEEYDDEYDDEGESEYNLPFTEEDEMELASDLLAINSEAEFDEFLGSLFKKIKRGARWVGRRARRGVRRAWRRARSPLKRAFKSLARRGLSWGGKALGSYFGGPAGGALGGKAANWAAKAFGLELEGLSPEDQEFETARRLVRLTGEAIRNLDGMDQGGSPDDMVRQAMERAASRHAPGLVGSIRGRRSMSQRASGTWVRKGNHIILKGAR